MQSKPDLAALARALPAAQGITFLGEGGFKAVYRATIGGRTEALKVIFIPHQEDFPDAHDEILARVKREIQALSLCHCPNLVRLGCLTPQACEIDGQTYVAYSEEFLEGLSLRSEIRSGRKPTFDASRTLMVCLLEVIRELKAMKLIHRDIKPDNVLAVRDPARRFVVLDLGVAYKLESTPITRNPGERVGTLPYMAPEQFTPNFHQALDYRSDLYSAAVTVYEYASQVHPVASRPGDDYTTIWRIVRMRPFPLSQHRPDFPEEFCRLVDQLMRKKPALRPSAIDALLTNLEAMQ